MNTQLFLKRVFRRCEGYVQITYLHPDGEAKKYPHFEYIKLPIPDTLELKIAEYQAQGYGVHFRMGTVREPLPTGKRGTKFDTYMLPGLWLDVDGATPEHLNTLKAARPFPTMIAASGGGYHAYWIMSKPILMDGQAARSRAEQIMRGMCLKFNGDVTCADTAQMMRLPGTINTKYLVKPERKPDVATVAHENNLLCAAYSVFDKFEIPAPPTLPPIRRAMPPADISRGLPQWLDDEAGSGAPEGTRNARAFWFVNRLHERVDQPLALRQAETFAANCNPPLALETVRRMVDSTYRRPSPGVRGGNLSAMIAAKDARRVGQ